MPRSRARGATWMPRIGDDTILPAMLISPPVGCSSPATQRRVVVLPQPDGPSSTTISPAGTLKLTPSTAGRPIAKRLVSAVTSSAAVMVPPVVWLHRSLAVPENLVPIGHPGRVQLHIFVELRVPDPHHLGIEALGVDRRHLQRGEIAELLDHEGLAFLRQAPVEEQLCGVRMRR